MVTGGMASSVCTAGSGSGGGGGGGGPNRDTTHKGNTYAARGSRLECTARTTSLSPSSASSTSASSCALLEKLTLRNALVTTMASMSALVSVFPHVPAQLLLKVGLQHNTRPLPRVCRCMLFEQHCPLTCAQWCCDSPLHFDGVPSAPPCVCYGRGGCGAALGAPRARYATGTVFAGACTVSHRVRVQRCFHPQVWTPATPSSVLHARAGVGGRGEAARRKVRQPATAAARRYAITLGCPSNGCARSGPPPAGMHRLSTPPPSCNDPQSSGSPIEPCYRAGGTICCTAQSTLPC